jgi:hypothetical protein
VPFNRTCRIIYLNLKFIGGCQGQIVSGQRGYASTEMHRKVRFQVLAVLLSSRRLAEANFALRWHIIAEYQIESSEAGKAVRPVGNTSIIHL